MIETIVSGIIRAVLASVAGWAIKEGIMDSDTTKQVIAALMFAGVAIWSAYEKYRNGHTIQPVAQAAGKAAALLLLVSVVMLQTGCVSAYLGSQHTAKVERSKQLNALKMGVDDQGRIFAAFDWFKVPGWWGLVKEEPGTALLGAGADATLLGGAAYLCTRKHGGGGGGGGNTITGDNNTIYQASKGGTISDGHNTTTTSTGGQ